MTLSARRTKPVRFAEAALWTGATITLALGFGALLAAFVSRTVAGQFYAGWLTEYSLSLDNLLVFALLINSSKVPQRLHGRVLMLGICLALVLRGIFIAAGAAALQRFDWLQYFFGVFLVGAAIWMARQRGGSGQDAQDAGSIRAARWLTKAKPPTTRAGAAARGARRLRAAPFLLLAIAIGITDVMFALDSIPAIFGLTRDPYVVFTANLFALMGLRHLYFLAGGLLRRLVHLSAGVAAVLAFIGFKFLGEALRSSGVHHVGPLPVPHVSAVVSLAVIVGVMAVTAGASLALGSPRRARQGQADTRPAAGGSPVEDPKPAAHSADSPAEHPKAAAHSNLAEWGIWDPAKPAGHNKLPALSPGGHNNLADRYKLAGFSRLVELSKLKDHNELPSRRSGQRRQTWETPGQGAAQRAP